MVLKGLDAYGKYDMSHEIACEHLDAVVDVFERTNTLFENYAPEYTDGKANKGSSSMGDFVGWTGLSPISILFEYAITIPRLSALSRWERSIMPLPTILTLLHTVRFKYGQRVSPIGKCPAFIKFVSFLLALL